MAKRKTSIGGVGLLKGLLAILKLDVRYLLPVRWWPHASILGVTILWLFLAAVLLTGGFDLWFVLVALWALSATVHAFELWRGHRARKRARVLYDGICPRCRYDLQGSRSVKCPECGYWHGRRFDQQDRRLSRDAG